MGLRGGVPRGSGAGFPLYPRQGLGRSAQKPRETLCPLGGGRCGGHGPSPWEEPWEGGSRAGGWEGASGLRSVWGAERRRGGGAGAEARPGSARPASALHSQPSRGRRPSAADLAETSWGPAPHSRGCSPATNSRARAGAQDARPPFIVARSPYPTSQPTERRVPGAPRGLPVPLPPGAGNAPPARAAPALGLRQTLRRDPRSAVRRGADAESRAAARAARALRGAAPTRHGARRTQRSRRWRSQSPRADERRDMQVSARCPLRERGAPSPAPGPRPQAPRPAAWRRPSWAPASETS